MRYVKFGPTHIDILIPVVIIFSYFFGFLEQLLIAYLAVFVHEAAHAVIAAFLGADIVKVYFLCYGTKVELNINIESRLQKAFVYAAGPLINLIIAMLFLFLGNSIKVGITNLIIISNLSLAIFNLLPISPLDGGEILSVYTASKYGFFYSRKLSQKIFTIAIIIFLLISLPVALFMRNFSILIIAIFLLLKEKRDGEAAFMNARNLYYRRARLLRKGYYGVRELVVLERLTLGEAFKLMDFDQYHILIILDENMKILHRFTESEILSAINDLGYSITFKELIESIPN